MSVFNFRKGAEAQSISIYFQELFQLSVPIFCGEHRHKRITTAIWARAAHFLAALRLCENFNFYSRASLYQYHQFF